MRAARRRSAWGSATSRSGPAVGCSIVSTVCAAGPRTPRRAPSARARRGRRRGRARRPSAATGLGRDRRAAAPPRAARGATHAQRDSWRTRGSSARSSRPASRQKRANWSSVADRQVDVAVGGLERLVRDDRRVGVARAAPARSPPISQSPARLASHATWASSSDTSTRRRPRRSRPRRTQRRQDAGAGELAGDDVRDRDRDLHRLAVGLALHAHDPADALHHEVVAGPGGVGVVGRVAADRAVNDAGVAAFDRLVVEPEPLDGARQEVLDDDVGAGGQPLGDGDARPDP